MTAANARSPHKISISRWLIQGALIGLGSGILSIASETLTPSSVRSQVGRAPVSYVLNAADDISFLDLMQRAEKLATDDITRTFATNASLSDWTITIAAERNGTIAPLFSVQVSRASWQAQPLVAAWARYLPVSSVLLGFQTVQSGAATARSTAPVAPPSAAPFNPNSEPNFYNPLIPLQR